MRTAIIVMIILSVTSLVRAERLTFAGLKENETIVIGYRSAGCFHFEERKYVVRGGDKARFMVYEVATQGREQEFKGPERLLVDEHLSERERLGFDHYLFYLSGVKDGGCTTVTEVSVGYYRNNEEVGQDHFEDGSCALNIYYYDGKLVYDERPPAQLSRRLYRAIIPPRELEKKLVAAGKTALPTSEKVAIAR